MPFTIPLDNAVSQIPTRNVANPPCSMRRALSVAIANRLRIAIESSRKASPAAVSSTVRVLRWIRQTPIRSSSRRMLLLITDWLAWNCSDARVKLRDCATATKCFNSLITHLSSRRINHAIIRIGQRNNDAVFEGQAIPGKVGPVWEPQLENGCEKRYGAADHALLPGTGPSRTADVEADIRCGHGGGVFDCPWRRGCGRSILGRALFRRAFGHILPSAEPGSVQPDHRRHFRQRYQDFGTSRTRSQARWPDSHRCFGCIGQRDRLRAI